MLVGIFKSLVGILIRPVGIWKNTYWYFETVGILNIGILNPSPNTISLKQKQICWMRQTFWMREVILSKVNWQCPPPDGIRYMKKTNDIRNNGWKKASARSHLGLSISLTAYCSRTQLLDANGTSFLETYDTCRCFSLSTLNRESVKGLKICANI